MSASRGRPSRPRGHVSVSEHAHACECVPIGDAISNRWRFDNSFQELTLTPARAQPKNKHANTVIIERTHAATLLHKGVHR